MVIIAFTVFLLLNLVFEVGPLVSSFFFLPLIMGDLGEGGGPASSSSGQASFIGPQKEWLTKALELYGPLMGQGQPIYPGQTVAPLSTQQQNIIGTGAAFQNVFQPFENAPLFGETQEALTGLLQGTTGPQPYTPEAAEQYYKGTIEQPARRMYEKDIAPAITEMWAGPGYWGSARAKAQQEGRQDFEQWLGSERSQLYWDVEQQNKAIEEAKANRALQATGPAMQFSQIPTQENLARLQGLEEAYGFAQIPQQQRQAEINAAIEKFQQGQRLTDPEVMNIMLSLLGMQDSHGYETETGPGFWYSALQPAFGALAAGG